MVIRNGPRPNREGRGDQRVLTLRSSAVVEKVLAGYDLTGCNIEELGRWGNALAVAARVWVGSRGYGERGQITRADAERIYRQAFARVTA